MNCKKCNTPIVLSPSASERAEKYGNTPAYYKDLFTVCSECQVTSWYYPINHPPKPKKRTVRI